MPGTGKSEVIFVAAMMILIMIFSITAVYVFFRTYKKEMRDKDKRQKAKVERQKDESETDDKPLTTDH